MFETTSAIVLHCQKYSDKAVILHSYTQKNGRMNWIVYGGNKKGNLKGLIQTPLTIIDIQYETKTGTSMYVPHSVSPHYLPQKQDNTRQLVRVFVSEVIYKTLRQPMADERLYDFLETSIQSIDDISDIETFPKPFLQQFSVLLGYGGEWLEEWKELNSLDMLREMLN